MARVLREGRFEAVYDFVYDWEHGTTASQVEAAARSCRDGLHRYVFISSIAAYGPGLDHRESEPLVPDDCPNLTRSTRPPVNARCSVCTRTPASR